jgi:hypothetical protein
MYERYLEDWFGEGENGGQVFEGDTEVDDCAFEAGSEQLQSAGCEAVDLWMSHVLGAPGAEP